MSRAGFHVIHFLSKPIAHFIERASPREITIGWISGMIVGSLVSLCSKDLPLVPLVAVGAILGAFVIAVFSPAVRRVQRPAGWIGAIRNHWTYTYGEFVEFIVLLDHALFRTVSGGDPDIASAIALLKAGEEPPTGRDLPRTLIPFDDVTAIEYRRAGKGITFTTGTGRRVRRESMSLPTRDDRDTLLKEILDTFDPLLESHEREMETSRAVFVPLATSTVLVWLTLVTVWVTASWKATPPEIAPSLRGYQDYVDWLTGMGPLGVAWRGGLICLSPLAWLLYRYLNPPQLVVLTPQGALQNSSESR